MDNLLDLFKYNNDRFDYLTNQYQHCNCHQTQLAQPRPCVTEPFVLLKLESCAALKNTSFSAANSQNNITKYV